jgi:hypothetical protein
VPAASLHPESAWSDKAEFYATLSKLGRMFLKNFEHFHDGDAFVGEAMATRIMSGGPVLPPGEQVEPAAANIAANGAAAAGVVDMKALKAAAAAEVAAAQHVANGSACNGCAAGSAC